MGVNMPARTVVFDSIRKHDGTGFRNLLPGLMLAVSSTLSSKATIDHALSSPEDELQNTCILMSLSCFELYFQVSTFRWRAEPAGGAWTPQAPSSFCVRPEFTRWQICTSWCWWGFKISFRGVLKSHSTFSPVFFVFFACVTKKVCWVILSSFNCTAEWVILAHFPSAAVWRPVVLFQCCLQQKYFSFICHSYLQCLHLQMLFGFE